MVTLGFSESTTYLTLSATMNPNQINRVNHANAWQQAREEAAEREVAFVEEQEEARAEEARAAWAAAEEAAEREVAFAEEQEEARAAAAEAEEEEFNIIQNMAKKQRVDKRRRGTGESVMMAEGLEQGLEEAGALIEELQSRLVEMETFKKKYQALAAMLNDLGVDDNKIAEHLGNWLSNWKA